MDIRTRLVLALVFFSLASMTLLGMFAYTTSATLLQKMSLRQLDTLAESKKQEILKVYGGWEDNLRLVKHRTQLRKSIRDYVKQGSRDARRQVERIIQGIVENTAIDGIDKLSVFTSDGSEIASFGISDITPSSISSSEAPVSKDITYEGAHVGTHPDKPDGVQLVLSTDVQLDGEMIGRIELIIDAAKLLDVTTDYTGLGDTGEAFVVMKTRVMKTTVMKARVMKATVTKTTVINTRDMKTGGMKTSEVLQRLNPPRHQLANWDSRQPLATASDDMRRAFPESRPIVPEEHTDYRGEVVWSVTRLLPVQDWGLVVKVDVNEEEKRVHELRKSLFDIAIALSAFAIIGGALLGFYLARPIRRLAVVVEKIQQGETHIRAEVKGNDEIAYLAKIINLYMDDIESERQDATSQLAQHPPDDSRCDD